MQGSGGILASLPSNSSAGNALLVAPCLRAASMKARANMRELLEGLEAQATQEAVGTN
jgi:hypothetical protein